MSVVKTCALDSPEVLGKEFGHAANTQVYMVSYQCINPNKATGADAYSTNSFVEIPPVPLLIIDVILKDKLTGYMFHTMADVL